MYICFLYIRFLKDFFMERYTTNLSERDIMYTIFIDWITELPFPGTGVPFKSNDNICKK